MSKLTKALTAAAGNAGGDPLYAEDVFSTYLYTGTGSAMTITNGVNLEDNGGIVWTKPRTSSGESHRLIDADNSTILASDGTNAKLNGSLSVPQYYLQNNTDGFDLVGNISVVSGVDYASWTFRKAEKFFDVVTFSGNSVAGRTIAHNLGSVPGMIIIKCTSTARSWVTYHTSLGATKYLTLNSANASATTSVTFNNTEPTDSVFSVGTANSVNISGATYVAYLFASDAGGFGEDETDNIIKCGSFTTDSNAKFFANTGFEPQWVLVKRSDGTGAWNLLDTMRGLLSEGTAGGKYLRPNTSGVEGNLSSTASEYINATGFGGNGGGVTGSANATFIYIAIRRPMKTPESGTEVFALQNPGYPLGSNGLAYTSGFPVDWALSKEVSATDDWIAMSRLQGAGNRLKPNTTGAEAGGISSGTFDHMTGWYKTTSANMSWMFKRATGFFDMVAYSGSGSATTQAHNLGVVPELIIVKTRSDTNNWPVYSASLSNTGTLFLNSADAGYSGIASYWNSTTPTASVFSLGNSNTTNGSGSTLIAYLFATLAGVSKVGSYTGTGADLNVDCGFSAGARFILIKRTDSTGGWHVWDSSRGISSNTDPYLLLNSSAAQVTNTDYVDPLASGFTVTSSAPAALNASGGTYIFLAIA